MTIRPLPPYTHIPGVTPHPIRDPAGHSYAEPKLLAELLEREQTELAPLTWVNLPLHPEFEWAARLFNAGYYWEAHEAWESLWHMAGRVGPLADFLKGLIKLAAAGVKLREHNSAGVERHALRARELFRSVVDHFDSCDTSRDDLPLEKLVVFSVRIAREPPPFPADRSGRPVVVFAQLPE